MFHGALGSKAANLPSYAIKSIDLTDQLELRDLMLGGRSQRSRRTAQAGGHRSRSQNVSNNRGPSDPPPQIRAGRAGGQALTEPIRLYQLCGLDSCVEVGSAGSSTG